MTSLVPLSFNPPFLHSHSHSFSSKPSSLSPSPSNLFVCFSSSPSSPSSSSSSSSSSSHNSSNFDREETRWLREEQRWLREEQRWLREEQRWLKEKESLLWEISQLKLQIQALENRNSFHGASVTETISRIGALLQVLKDKNRIAESGESARDMVFEEVKEKEVVVEEGVRVLEKKAKEVEKKIERKTLRAGSEGEQVREMQEALGKLGFYSGEEDIEFSSFSSGTERAVKTWQEGTNGTAITSLTEISEIQQKVVKEEGFTEAEVSQHRVFLLGENRWEEPSRLTGKDKQATGSENIDAKTSCHACRGEGRLMCAECDGTGEPNVEPQVKMGFACSVHDLFKEV
ncbi:hypothetical protein Gohar_026918 [Gossypium harknessii]|uniref:Peptidoglycan binding-like domain-containing protein n=1 Tax=Gossypium harknessii TaxID=34285 RepID=A0A7J9HT13_9ROSI|nr:hypothetical protein [Gossypium harknessii]